MNGDATAEKITAKEAYAALVQLVIHAESITWNRSYNFLMGNLRNLCNLRMNVL